MSQQMDSAAGEGVVRRETPTAERSFVWHAKLIGALTLVSRVLGLAREAFAARYFGADWVWSAFTVAFTVPNLFRKLFGEGALSAAFIPLYAKAVAEEGRTGREGTEARRHGGTKAEEGRTGRTGREGTEARRHGGMEAERDAKVGGGADIVEAAAISANEFAVASVNLLCMILLGVTVVGEVVLAGVYAWLVWGGEPRKDYLLAVRLSMLMLPYVLLVCGAAFVGGILQVHRRFAAVAATSIVLNLALIVAIVSAATAVDLTTEQGRVTGVWWLSWAVLVSGVIQLAMLVPSLRAVGFAFRPVLHVWVPAVRQMLRMSFPVAIGAGVLQLGVMLDKGISFVLAEAAGHTHFEVLGFRVAYPMAEGAAARLNWAQFMYQFPLGVFAIAIATAIFPKLAGDALEADRGAFRAVMRRGIEASLFIGLPASVGLAVVALPAVRLLFEGGNFDYADSQWVALSTAIYAAAIWAFSLQQILNRAYYALHDTTTPLKWAAWNLLINLVVELPLLWTPLRESGMAVGTLVSFSIQAVVMTWQLSRRVGGLGLGQVARPVAVMIGASVVMGVVLVAMQWLPWWPGGESRAIWAAQLAMLMAAGAAVYFGLCAAGGLGDVARLLRRR